MSIVLAQLDRMIDAAADSAFDTDGFKEWVNGALHDVSSVASNVGSTTAEAVDSVANTVMNGPFKIFTSKFWSPILQIIVWIAVICLVAAVIYIMYETGTLIPFCKIVFHVFVMCWRLLCYICSLIWKFFKHVCKNKDGPKPNYIDD